MPCRDRDRRPWLEHHPAAHARLSAARQAQGKAFRSSKNNDLCRHSWPRIAAPALPVECCNTLECALSSPRRSAMMGNMNEDHRTNWKKWLIRVAVALAIAVLAYAFFFFAIVAAWDASSQSTHDHCPVGPMRLGEQRNRVFALPLGELRVPEQDQVTAIFPEERLE